MHTVTLSHYHTITRTQDQYFFIYEAISEALLCGNTEVPLDHLPGYVNELCNVIPEDDMDTTHIELQFKVCKRFSQSAIQFSVLYSFKYLCCVKEVCLETSFHDSQSLNNAHIVFS